MKNPRIDFPADRLEAGRRWSAEAAPFWLLRLFLCLIVLLAAGACYSGSPPLQGRATGNTTAKPPAGCRIRPVSGDTRAVAVGAHSLLVVGEGIGLLRSDDDGRSFENSAPAGDMHWPAITFGNRGALVSWISPGELSVLHVAAVDEGLHGPVDVYSSKNPLIDTEILELSTGELLLLASEVVGPPNSNRAAYTVHCFCSGDGGHHWEERSRPVSAPWGVNIEDPRLIEVEGGRILLAFEWEDEEGGPSRILIEFSDDAGRSWSVPEILWAGRPSDREPGGFFRRNGLLYFVASSDRDSGRSYAGAFLRLFVSDDGGKSWKQHFSPVPDPDQLSMGAVVLEDRVLLLSLRFYSTGHPELYFYPLDSLGFWLLPCPGISSNRGCASAGL